MSSFFSHPPSPPQDHQPLPSTSSRAKHTSETNERLDGAEPPRTEHRKGKSLGLRKTRTESSLPTPPRTRDTRRTSQSPAGQHAQTSSPPCIPEDHPSHSRSSSSRLASFAALSSFRRPTFASQLGAPVEEGGLIPPPLIHPTAAPANPFISSLAAGPSSSSSVSTSSNKRPRYSASRRAQPSTIPEDEQAEADILRASPIPPPSAHHDDDASDPDIFRFSPLPSSSRSTTHEKPRGRLLDFLGPTRHLARHPTSPALSPLPTHSLSTLTPPPTTARKTSSTRRRLFPPPLSPAAQARLDTLSNPFLSGLGLVKKGKIGPERVGRLEERETIGYVFRGTKTVFANPFFKGGKGKKAEMGEDEDELDEDEDEEGEEFDYSTLPVDHPDYSPAENPLPRLLFPVASTSTAGPSTSSRFEDSTDSDSESESEDDLGPGSGIRPRLLFPAADLDLEDSDDEDEVIVEKKSELSTTPFFRGGVGVSTPKRRGVKRTSPDPEEEEGEMTVFGTPSGTPRKGDGKKKMRL